MYRPKHTGFAITARQIGRNLSPYPNAIALPETDDIFTDPDDSTNDLVTYTKG